MSDSEVSKAFRDITAGSIGGAVSLIPSQPWDVVKVRIQTRRFTGGMGQCFFEIFQKEGMRGFYKGTSFPLAGQVAINATVFGVEGYTRRWLPKDPGEGTIYGIGIRMISGGAGGAVQSLICSPMELVKISMQLKNVGEGKTANYRGPIKEAKNILRQGGVRGIYSGLWVTTLRDSMGFAAYFAPYYGIRQSIASVRGLSSIDELGLLSLAVSGGMAGSISWAVNYPVEIIKTLIQEDTIKEMVARESGQAYTRTYTGVLSSARIILAQSGMRGLYGGLGPCLVRAFFNGITLLPTSTIIERNWPY